MKEVYLYKKLRGKKVQCHNCAHYCSILPRKRGICGTKENQNGKLASLNYGKLIACQIDPIEKKPLFHFLPGSHSLSIATVGCNFKCKFCQNWDISQKSKPANQILGEEISPKEIIKVALKNKLPSISYTYTEPAIFSEYALDIMKLAKKEGIKNVWVSNGFWSKELFDLVSPYLDAANIDLKSFSPAQVSSKFGAGEDEFYINYCNGKLQPVLETLKRLKETPRQGSGREKIWVEITTLIIPTLNDRAIVLKNIAQFIKKELGAETPWHVTQFSGAISWKLQDLPNTSVETLKAVYQIGKDVGLKYVYTGNIPGLPSEDTFCPECNALMIDRTGYSVSRYDKGGKCSKCKADLNLILK